MSLTNTESVFKYFKNLIYLGKDEEGNPNKNDLNAHDQYLIELCAEYVRRNFIKEDKDD